MAAVRRTCLLDFITFLLCFLFLQHRGCVAAISIWSSNPTTSQNSVYTIGCYVTGRHRDSEIVIGRYLDTGTGRVDEAYHVDQSTTRQESISDYGFPPGSVLDVINNEENNFKLYNISISNGTDKFGAYYCGVNGVDEAKVVTVVNAVKTEALVVPESYSYSISTDDDIRLSVELTGENDPSDLRWRRNSTISVEQWKGLSQVNIDDANSNIPEIYEATLKKKRKGLHAIMLLNVRGCPAGKWGSDCSSDCPRCLNRGICDAKTGNCTCLQGFMGEVCQTACPESYFGTDCDVLCTTDGACAGHYVCQPGPFGCACTAGYHGRNCDLVLPKLSSFPNIENVESNKVTVSWDIWNEQRDVGSGPVIGYVVWYKKSSSDEWFRKPNDRILSTNSTVVDSLKFNTQYEFSVQSVVSDDEVIVRGPTTQKKTKCGTPTVAIANIEVVATGGNSLQVSWQMPDLNKNNMQCKVDSQDTSFVIKYKKDTDVAYERKTVPHDVPHDVPNQTTIHDLESCTNYTIVMVVFNGVSYGPESQVVSGVTSVSDPVEVEDLQVETQQTDATSLHIEWNRPSQCQYEYSYEIKYKLLTKGTCEIADSDWTTPVSVDNNVYDINQLFPNSEYKVCVKSVIGEKESGDVKKSGKTDIAALTDIVQNFSTSSITHNALELTWNRPPCGEPNGPLSYEVNLLEYNNDQFKKKKNQVVSENACKFEKLLIYTRYKATIVAMNNKGNGPPTSIDVQTLQYYPSAPINLSVVRTSLTSIELQWSAPVTPNGIITQYNIEWMLHNTKSNGREPIDAVTRYNMTSLVPDSTYEICVQAVTMVGNGLCSNYIMANTGIPGNTSNDFLSVSVSDK
ncbi:tyrosine-protein phosphatase Lar-like, partial [Saccoglossus kowalevskii]